MARVCPTASKNRGLNLSVTPQRKLEIWQYKLLNAWKASGSRNQEMRNCSSVSGLSFGRIPQPKARVVSSRKIRAAFLRKHLYLLG